MGNSTAATTPTHISGIGKQAPDAFWVPVLSFWGQVQLGWPWLCHIQKLLLRVDSIDDTAKITLVPLLFILVQASSYP